MRLCNSLSQGLLRKIDRGNCLFTGCQRSAGLESAADTTILAPKGTLPASIALRMPHAVAKNSPRVCQAARVKPRPRPVPTFGTSTLAGSASALFGFAVTPAWFGAALGGTAASCVGASHPAATEQKQMQSSWPRHAGSHLMLNQICSIHGLQHMRAHSLRWHLHTTKYPECRSTYTQPVMPCRAPQMQKARSLQRSRCILYFPSFTVQQCAESDEPLVYASTDMNKALACSTCHPSRKGKVAAPASAHFPRCCPGGISSCILSCRWYRVRALLHICGRIGICLLACVALACGSCHLCTRCTCAQSKAWMSALQSHHEYAPSVSHSNCIITNLAKDRCSNIQICRFIEFATVPFCTDHLAAPSDGKIVVMISCKLERLLTSRNGNAVRLACSWCILHVWCPHKGAAILSGW